MSRKTNTQKEEEMIFDITSNKKQMMASLDSDPPSTRYKQFKDGSFTKIRHILIRNEEELNNVCFLENPKIKFSSFNGEEGHNESYCTNLVKIYKIINDGVKIIDSRSKTYRNKIKTGVYKEKGFSPIMSLGISIQRSNTKTTLKEIMYQCKFHEIKLVLEIECAGGTSYKIQVP